MSQYSNKDTERVYRISREYMEETQRYLRMVIDANPEHKQIVDYLLTALDNGIECIQGLKEQWQDSIKVRNPDWDGLGQ